MMLSNFSLMSLINPSMQIQQWLFDSVYSIGLTVVILDFKRLFDSGDLNQGSEVYPGLIEVIE